MGLGDAQAELLIDEGERNGGFEESHPRPWRTFGHKMTRFETELVSANDQAEPVDGAQMLKVVSVGGSETRLSARVAQRIEGIDLDDGRVFTLSFQGLSVDPDTGFDRLLAAVLLWQSGNKRPVLIEDSRPQLYEADGWQQLEFTFTVDPSIQADSVEVRIHLIRGGTSDTDVEAVGYFDAVRLEQKSDEASEAEPG